MPDTFTTPAPPPRTATIGDPVPPILARYYAAIDGGRVDEASATFAAEGLYAVPLPGGIETKPRAETVGPPTLAERFAARGPKPWTHHVDLCVVEGGRALVEGVLRDDTDRAIATFMASAHVDADGLLDRYLAFACDGARDPLPTGVAPDTAPAAAGTVLHDYFAALDRGDTARAAACFSEDTLYSHPPYKHTGLDGNDRVEFRGRPALLEAFGARGRASFDHRILACIQRGPHCIVEGLVEGLPDDGTGSFLSSLSLDADGLIDRYVSFYCEPGVAFV